jgi:hypothetical protein
VDVDLVVLQLGPDRFRVLVAGTGGRSEHEVRLPQHARQGLGLRGVPPVQVVEESFRFLLERKEPADIPAAFVLPTIAGEFPEYPEEIRMRLG